jgi:hypothetical protein
MKIGILVGASMNDVPQTEFMDIALLFYRSRDEDGWQGFVVESRCIVLPGT